jgi:hypothetical protein
MGIAKGVMTKYVGGESTKTAFEAGAITVGAGTGRGFALKAGAKIITSVGVKELGQSAARSVGTLRHH